MSRRFDVALFLILACLWGLSYSAIEIGLEQLPPLLFAAVRYDVAAVLLLGVAAVRVDHWLPVARQDRLAILGGGLFLVAGNGLLFVGQQTVPSGVASILQALIPILTALWALLLLGERLSRPGVLGVAIGFVGIGFVVQPTPSTLFAGDTVGRLLIVTQVTSVSLGGVLVQRANPTIGRLSLTGWSMLIGALILHVASLLARETTIVLTGPRTPGLPVTVTAETAIAVTPRAIGAILYLGIFATAIAFLLYFTLLRKRGAFEAGLVSYLVPVVGTVVGVFVLGESIDPLTLLGFGLVAVGFALLKREAIADLTGLTGDGVTP